MPYILPERVLRKYYDAINHLMFKRCYFMSYTFFHLSLIVLNFGTSANSCDRKWFSFLDEHMPHGSAPLCDGTIRLVPFFLDPMAFSFDMFVRCDWLYQSVTDVPANHRIDLTHQPDQQYQTYLALLLRLLVANLPHYGDRTRTAGRKRRTGIVSSGKTSGTQSMATRTRRKTPSRTRAAN